ncbi:MAG: hypothetical protein AB8E15_12110 [Bdellovibrionales bacterium]
MKVAAIFSTAGVLDFEELRSSIVRIPEVLSHLKEAQKYIDRSVKEAPDLVQFLTSEDSIFWRNNKYRQICVAVVQLALYKRYLKYHPNADFILSINKPDNPIKTLTGEMRMGEFVINMALKEEEEAELDNIAFLDGDMPQLSKGISMPDYQVFRKNEEGNFILEDNEKRSLMEILEELRDEESVKRFVNLGPGKSVSGTAMQDLQTKELNILESIDIDPMLSWFWSSVSPSSYQIAN